MKKVIAALATAILLTGCATNIGFDESQANNFGWVEHNPGWKIASDYYHLKNGISGITYTVYGYPRITKINKVDPRFIDHLQKALELKGYSKTEIQALGSKNIAAANMPEKMLNEWISTSDAYDLAEDLFWLNHPQYRHVPLEFKVLPGGATPDIERTKVMYVVALQEKGIPEKYSDALLSGKLAVGMPELGIYATWGKPKDCTEHTSSMGVTKQYSYGSVYVTGSHVSNTMRFIHTLNGKVTSWTEY